MKKLLLLIALIISGVGLNAQSVGDDTIIDYEGYSLQFTVTSLEPAECEVKCSTVPTTETELIMPSTVTINDEFYSVTSIADSAFMGCDKFVGDLLIPNTVKSVGIRAFRDCVGFEGSLTLSENLEIINNLAFAGGGGVHVNYTGELIIPNKVKHIGQAAFQNCSSLTSVTFGANSQLVSIGDYAFQKCSSLTGDLIIPNSVTSIGNCAFWECRGFNGSLVLSENLDTISDYAFGSYEGEMGFKGELIIPNKVKHIGLAAFQKCSSLEMLLFDDNSQLTSIGDYAFIDCSSLTGDLIIPNSVTSIGDYAFWNCSSLTGDLIIPNSITSIGSVAFFSCLSLTSVTFEDNSQLTSIGDNAFSSCLSLTSVTFEDNSQLTSIGIYAFSNCSSLEYVEIPSNVTAIADYAFSNCSSLKSIICYAENVPYTAGIYVFHNVPSDMVIYVPTNSVNAYKTSFPWMSYTILSIPNVIITVNPENAGTVTGTGTYLTHDTVTLTAIPNEGYRFVNWTENDEVISTNTEYLFTITSNVELVANFELQTYDVTVTINPENAGTVTGAGTYKYLQTVNLIATENEGYKFVCFKNKNGDIISEIPDHTFAITEDNEIIADFISTENINELSSSFNIYPNPVNDKLYIETEVEIKEVAVYDVYGRKLSAVGYQQSAIDVTDLNSGVYFVKVVTENGDVIKRFVKK